MSNEKPISPYLLCCVQRSGSWLLAHSLADTGIAGIPRDYFDEAEYNQNSDAWGTDGFSPYLAAVRSRATTPNGVFGTKMMWNDFGPFRDALRREGPYSQLSDPRMLAAAFPGITYIWLRREDKIRQGISWWRAVVTDQWAVRQGEQRRTAELELGRILTLVRYAEDCERGWRDWFERHGVHPLEVTYEQLVRDRLTVVNSVLRHLGVPPLSSAELPLARYVQQADELTNHWVPLIREALDVYEGDARP